MAYNQQQPPGYPHQRHPAQAGSWQPAPYGQFPAAPVGYAVPPGGYYAPPAAPMGYAGRPAMPVQPQVAPGPYPAASGPSPSPTAASPAPAFPPTAFGQGGDPFAAIANNPLANLGLQYVHQNLLPSKVGWLHYFSFSHLKYYFSVSNSYVLNKIKVLLCPFAHRNWKREEIAHPSAGLDAEGTPHVYYRPPKEDINAPDLYIPMMAFITYILLMGLALGMYHRFTPESLSIIASSAMVTLLLEVGVMRLGFYMVGTVQTPSMFDLVAYCAYKYVGLLVDLSVGILVGSNLIFYGVVIVNAFFASVFTLRTVKRALTPNVASGISEDDGANARRSYFLLLLAVVQFLSSMFLVKNAIPAPVS